MLSTRQLVQLRPAVAPLAKRFFASTKVANADHTFKLDPFDMHKIEDEGPSTDCTISSEEAIELYTQMTKIRKMETAAGDLYKTKFVRGFCHLYTGQEAVATGMHSVLKKGDSWITSYRCHGITWLLGASMEAVLGELCGRSCGVSQGKGGSMHMYWDHFYGGNGIVGAQTSLGAGLGFYHQYKNTGGLSVAMYGDGAANQGQLFEAMNMAKLWDLPTLFICENNRYGMGTSQERSSASIDYYARGDYIPGIRVNGMDILHVREATKYAAEYARSGKGPLVLEMVTYRYGGHSMSDPGTSYRTRDEVKKMRQGSDPIMGLKNRIIEAGMITEEEIKAIDKQAKEQVDAAVAVAKESPEIDDSGMVDHTYALPIQKIRGMTMHETFTPPGYTAPMDVKY
ncbi:pyruvate dehydrogenase E1 component subunit alpha, mitochondrial [Sphaeroforma arctica JP610]|uniref:Pyruvate dehydrogenase E1 component subunit alpha n=1 Tax=Sphaeroforma arctica JP610 TaxID=667725 RepID=A0A0L0FRB6_9EUKA|nr:pyruvate dehydrogenase E1 component subunit alpha, mitochondrial [Sphaeroforma arctica JP610]KNC79320.1 pyruvate dehydrogenase E1 component subunit alpha, mitochondrial [Sphaeroforma arctica JP610]|eukprot:XP_014153222.1 pyruvate dehydrogenase E1 component subunit alpha, mitochondrial [Sphaeroforma arctica JP610]